jgi:hypothetical protein
VSHRHLVSGLSAIGKGITGKNDACFHLPALHLFLTMCPSRLLLSDFLSTATLDMDLIEIS